MPEATRRSAAAAVHCGGPACPPTHRVQHVQRLAAAAAAANH